MSTYTNVLYLSGLPPTTEQLAERFKKLYENLEDKESRKPGSRLRRLLKIMFEQITSASSHGEDLSDLYLWKVKNPDMELIRAYEDLGVVIMLSAYRDQTAVKFWVGLGLTNHGVFIDVPYRYSVSLHKGTRTIH